MQSPSVAGINESSITLRWNEPPPEVPRNPQRNITQYVVTVSPQDGGDAQVVLVPAEAGAEYIIAGLQPVTPYDINVNVVINTEGQGDKTYDIGVLPLTVMSG